MADQKFDPTDTTETWKDVRIRGMLPKECWKEPKLIPFLAQLCVPSFTLHINWCGEYRELKPGTPQKYDYDNSDFNHYLHFYIHGGKDKISNKYLNDLVRTIENVGGAVTHAVYEITGSGIGGYTRRDWFEIVGYDSLWAEAALVAERAGMSVEEGDQIRKIQHEREIKPILEMAFKKFAEKDRYVRYYPDILVEWLDAQGVDVYEFKKKR
jgi:hypothetical protein